MTIVTVGPDEQAPALALPAILLVNPKISANVVNSYRTAACFGFPQVWCTGHRVGRGRSFGRRTRLPPEERMRGFDRVDLIWCDHALDVLGASNARLVAVELGPDTQSLLTFDHADGDCVYVFGPEDGSLDDAVLARCTDRVQIPSFHCLNLASAVATVAWDRCSKLWRQNGVPAPKPVDFRPQASAGDKRRD